MPSPISIAKTISGLDKASQVEFAEVLRSVYEMKRRLVDENNAAIKDVFNSYGYHRADFAWVLIKLRNGADGDRVVRMDLMVEYASLNYRHLMGVVGSESNSGSDWDAAVEWMCRGYLEVPSIDDQDIIEDALWACGLCGDGEPEWVCSESSSTPASVPGSVYRSMKKLCDAAWLSIHDAGVVPFGLLSKIKRKFSRMDESARSELDGLLGISDLLANL